MNNKIIIFTFILLISIISFLSIKNSFSYQTLYDILPSNVIVIGDNVLEGYVNPNILSRSAINYYKKTGNKFLSVYKYSGLDIDNKPIWGKYNDGTDSYISLEQNEIDEIENILKKKYNIN